MLEIAPPTKNNSRLNVLRFASDWIKDAAFEDSAAHFVKWKNKKVGKASGRQGESRGGRKEAKRVWVKYNSY
jgi:hypothetical protein